MWKEFTRRTILPDGTRYGAGLLAVTDQHRAYLFVNTRDGIKPVAQLDQVTVERNPRNRRQLTLKSPDGTWDVVAGGCGCSSPLKHFAVGTAIQTLEAEQVS